MNNYVLILCAISVSSAFNFEKASKKIIRALDTDHDGYLNQNEVNKAVEMAVKKGYITVQNASIDISILGARKNFSYLIYNLLENGKLTAEELKSSIIKSGIDKMKIDGILSVNPNKAIKELYNVTNTILCPNGTLEIQPSNDSPVCKHRSETVLQKRSKEGVMAASKKADEIAWKAFGLASFAALFGLVIMFPVNFVATIGAEKGKYKETFNWFLSTGAYVSLVGGTAFLMFSLFASSIGMLLWTIGMFLKESPKANTIVPAPTIIVNVASTNVTSVNATVAAPPVSKQ